MPRICCISDTHGYHDHVRVPPCDVLIHAGDYRAFLQWLERQPAQHKCLIDGNHDAQVQAFPDLARQMIAEYAPSVTYLRDEEVNIDGLTIWGSPYTPTFFQWYNMRDRGADIKRHWDLIPNHIDVLVTHGPSQGHLDWSRYGNEHCGCADLLEAVHRTKPRLHVFGHVHGGGPKGQLHAEIEHHDGSKTILVNASICDEGYRPTRQPQIIHL